MTSQMAPCSTACSPPSTQLESCLAWILFYFDLELEDTVPSVFSFLLGLSAQASSPLTSMLKTSKSAPWASGSRYPVVSLAFPGSISTCPKPTSISSLPNLLHQALPISERGCSTSSAAQAPHWTILGSSSS